MVLKGLRPNSITFDVYSGNALIDTLTVTSAQGWLKESSDLDSDVRIVAHDVQGYSSSVSKNPKTGFTITYTLIGDDSSQPDKLGQTGGDDALSDGEGTDNDKIEQLDEPIPIGVKVTKVWKDNDNADGKRPTSVNASYTIRGDGPNPFEIKESDGWTYTITDVSLGEGDSFTVEEDAVEGYTSQVTGNATEGFTITNTLNEDTPADNNNDGGSTPSEPVKKTTTKTTTKTTKNPAKVKASVKKDDNKTTKKQHSTGFPILLGALALSGAGLAVALRRREQMISLLSLFFYN